MKELLEQYGRTVIAVLILGILLGLFSWTEGHSQLLLGLGQWHQEETTGLLEQEDREVALDSYYQRGLFQVSLKKDLILKSGETYSLDQIFAVSGVQGTLACTRSQDWTGEYSLEATGGELEDSFVTFPSPGQYLLPLILTDSGGRSQYVEATLVVEQR